VSRRNPASGEPPADVEIGASARARRLRFRSKPKTEVRTYGRTRIRSESGVEEIEGDADSESDRRNLPEEVEPGVTYRDVEVGWAARARAELPDQLEDENDEEGDQTAG
jgi:hypothetical protein